MSYSLMGFSFHHLSKPEHSSVKIKSLIKVMDCDDPLLNFKVENILYPYISPFSGTAEYYDFGIPLPVLIHTTHL